MNKTVPTLPPNTTALERAIAVACAELVNVPVPLRELWNADRCPVALLPFLAWACSVDRWDDAWPESIKRGTIKASYFIHKHKGTIAAVRRVVESLGYLIRITEWWQTMPPGTPGTSFIIALPNGCQVKKWHLRLRFDSARKAAAELALKAGDESWPAACAPSSSATSARAQPATLPTWAPPVRCWAIAKKSSRKRSIGALAKRSALLVKL